MSCAIQEEGVYAFGPWRGPFDAVPAPAVSDALVTAKVRSDIARLSQGERAIAERLANEGRFPAESLQAIQEFYRGKIAEKQQVLDNLEEWRKRGTT